MKHVRIELVPAGHFYKGRILFCISVCGIPVAGTIDCFGGDKLSQCLRYDCRFRLMHKEPQAVQITHYSKTQGYHLNYFWHSHAHAEL